jgi:hypothetical protein
MADKETFFITEGKIDARDFENNVEALRFSIRKGYSDQQIKFWMDTVKSNIGEMEEKLKKVI